MRNILSIITFSYLVIFTSVFANTVLAQAQTTTFNIDSDVVTVSSNGHQSEDQKISFTAEEPSFTITIDENTNWWNSVKSVFGIKQAPKNLLIAVTNSKEELISYEVYSLNDDSIENFQVTQPDLKPGVYSLRGYNIADKIINSSEEAESFLSQSNTNQAVLNNTFAYGVLAINSNKTQYKLGETAYLQMASLDENGHTLCQSDLSLKLTSPTGQTETFTTEDGKIKTSGECGNNNVTDEPDYFVYSQLRETGTYTLELTNLDTGFAVEDLVIVADSPDYSVERIGASRINPFKSAYTMSLTVSSTVDRQVTITELVPATFGITPNEEFSIATDSEHQKLTWQLELKANEPTEINYEYQAPELSPNLFVLGPLTVTSDSELFTEATTWELASDATLPTIYVNATQGDGDDSGTITNQAGTACTSAVCASSIDEDTESANDTDYVTNDQSETTGTQGFQLDNMPSDFVSMDSLNIKVRYRRFSTGNDTVLLTAQIVQSDGTTALTNASSTLVTHSGSQDGSFTTTSPVSLTLTGTNNKTVWDGAELELTWTYSKAQGPDNQQIYVSATEINGVYTAATTTIAGTFYDSTEAGVPSQCDGSTQNLSLRINGGTAATTSCNGGTGAFSFTTPSQPSAGDTITIYSTGANKANTVLVSNGSSVTGKNLYANAVNVYDDQDGTITIADMVDYDSTTNDTDMLFDATVTPTLTVEAGNELHIPSSHTLSPGGAVSTPKLHLLGTYTGGSETLTLSGSGSGTSRPLYINGGTFTAPTTTTYTGTSALEVQNTTYSALNLQPSSGTPTYTLLAGTITAGNVLTTTPVTGATNNPTMNFSKLQINTGGSFTTGTGTLTLSGSGSGTSRPLYINGGSFTATSGGTTTFTGTSASDIEATSFNTLNLSPASGTPTFTLLSGTLSTSGLFTVSNGTTVNWETNDPTINLGGGLTLNSSSTWTKSSTATMTFGVNTTGVTLTDNNATKQDLGIVAIDGPKTLTLGSNVKMTSLDITTGDTLSASTFTLSLTGTGTPLTKTGTFTPGTGTVEYTSGSGVTALSSADTSFYNLTINGTGTFTAGINVTATNQVTVTSGTLAMGSNNLTVGSTGVTDSGTISVAGTLTQTGGTTTVNSSDNATAPTIGGAGTTTLYNLNIGTASDAVTNTFTLAGTVTVSNDLTLTDPGAGDARTFALSTNSLTVGSTSAANSGDITVPTRTTISQTSGTTTVKTSASGAAIIGGAGTLGFYNLTLAPDANGASITLGSAGSQTITIANNFTIGNGTNTVTATAETNDPILDVNGAFTNSGNATFTASSTGTFSVQGSWTNDGTFNEGTGTVTFDGSTNASLDSGCTTASSCTAENFYKLVINKASASNTLTLSTTNLRVTEDITITTGKLVQSTLSVQVDDADNSGTAITVAASGTWTNTSTGDLALGNDFNNSGTVTYGGSCSTDDIAITATASRTPDWTGAGTFSISDVDMSNQNAVASITVYSSTNTTGNTGNWTFDASCASVATSNSLSIAIWVNPTTSITSKAIMVKNSEFRLVTNSSSQPICQTNDGSWGTAATSNVAISTGSYHHLVCTYDYSSNTLRVYVNGEQTGISTSVPGFQDTANSWQFGTDASATYGDFSGTMDEARLYDRALTSADVKKLYNLTPGPVAYWSMNENSGSSSVLDTSGQAQTLTMNGSMSNSNWQPGKFGSGLKFDGVDDYVSKSNDENFDFGTGSFTLSGWFNTSSISQSTTPYSQRIATGTDDAEEYLHNNAIDITSSDLELVDEEFEGEQQVGLRFTNVTIPQGATIESAYVQFQVDETSSATTDIVITGEDIDDAPGFTTTTADITNRTKTSTTVNWSIPAWNSVDAEGADQLTPNIASIIQEIIDRPNWTSGNDIVIMFNGDGVRIAESYDGESTAAALLTVTPASYKSQHIISRYDDTGYKVWIDENDLLNFGIDDDSTWDPDDVITSSESYSDDTWHYFSAVKDSESSAIYLYVDGVLIGSDSSLSATGSLNSSTAAFTLGSDEPTNTSYFAGILDEISVYSYALSQKQIITDMNGGHPLGSSGSQAAYWKFDEVTGTTAYDSSVNANNLTLSTASWTTTGKYGGAWNGTNAVWLSRADDPNLDFSQSQDFAISTWFRSDSASNPGAIEYIVNKASSSIQGYAVYANTSGQICFGIDDDTSWGPDIASCTLADFYDNTWHNIVAVRDYAGSDSVNIYIDGILRKSTPDTTTATLENALSFYVGDRDGTDNGDEFAGDIDELKIYRAALSAEDVLLEYNQGKTAKLGVTSTSSTNIPDSSQARSYCVPGDTATCNPPVAEWKMDEGSGSSANDTSGTGNTGTLGASTAAPAWIQGISGSALQFDGTDDYLDIPTITLTGEFTISFWFNRDNIDNYRYFIAKDASGTVNKIGQETNGINFFIRVTDAGGTDTAQPLPSSGEWHYLTITRDSSNKVDLYIDQEEPVRLFSDAAQSGSAIWSVIGASEGSGANQLYSGKLDQFRIYDYARTPAQIAWEYNQGDPVAWYKLDECEGSTAYNSAETSNGDPAGSNGTINIGGSGSNTSLGTCNSGTSSQAWNNGSSGKINASIDFDGNDDYISMGTASEFQCNANTGFSVAAWYKWNSDASLDNNAVISRYDVSSNRDWMISNDYGGIRFTLATSATTSNDIYGSGINTGQWYHVVGTWDPITDTQKIYVDGKLYSTAFVSTCYSNPSNNTYIGATSSSPPSRYLDGQVDDVRFYNYPVTEEQVKLIMNSGAVHFE